MKKKLAFVFTNKYLVTIILFALWMCFFDQRDIFNTIEQKGKLNELLAKKHYYEKEIAASKQELTDLQNNSAALEKFAREKYMMKKEGEDIYLLEDTAEIKK